MEKLGGIFPLREINFAPPFTLQIQLNLNIKKRLLDCLSLVDDFSLFAK